MTTTEAQAKTIDGRGDDRCGWMRSVVTSMCKAAVDPPPPCKMDCRTEWGDSGHSH